MKAKTFFKPYGMRHIEMEWETPQTLYLWTSHIYRKALYYRYTKGYTQIADNLLGLLHEFIGNGEAYWREALQPFTSSVYPYHSIKRGLHEMEVRAENTINMGICWKCGEDLDDLRHDQCAACRHDNQCPTCEGFGTIITGWTLATHEDPSDPIEAECPDCRGIGDFDSYVEVQGA